ncbi:MAG: glycosyltransferase, partial [Candidatus Omnitrophica bacterium]|nr:glycosyltransferase [Candidatus Omnitrophota bacterium]
MENKIKVLHAITRLDRGGSSENTLLSVIGLARKGYKVDVLFGRSETADFSLLKEAEKAGVDFIEETDLVRDIHPMKDIFAFLNITKFLRDKRYDIVHTHSSKAGLICRAAARLSGKGKIVYTPHGHVFYGYFGRSLTRCIVLAEKVLASMTDVIVGLTPAECDEWLRQGIGKREHYVTIPSGIDFSEMDRELETERDIREELGVPPGNVLIGSIGRFVEVKGFECFIRAAVTLAKKRSDVSFLLAGDGPLREKYLEILDSAGVGKGIFHIIGWQDKTADVLKAMDLFVLPSLNEGMGRVIVEAMYMKKPVIASRVGGVPSLVTSDVGMLVNPEADDELVKTIEELIFDRHELEAMGARGRMKAVKDYSA